MSPCLPLASTEHAVQLITVRVYATDDAPEWHDNTKAQPGNNMKTLVELFSGRRIIAWQKFGVWCRVFGGAGINSGDIMRWRFLDAVDYAIMGDALIERKCPTCEHDDA